MGNDAEPILNEYLSKKLSLDEFKEAMNHPNLDQSHKLEITDVYFKSLGSVDITDQLIGQSSIDIREIMK